MRVPGVHSDGGCGCATWQCYMGQYNLPYIKTPILALNSNYDTWSVRNRGGVEMCIENLGQSFHTFLHFLIW